jgi:hypothetical protein
MNKVQRRKAMNNLLRIIAGLAAGRFYVFRPMATRRYRYKRIVKCPESGQPAEILVDASPGTTRKPKKKALSIRNCSLWPSKKGCTEGCVE